MRRRWLIPGPARRSAVADLLGRQGTRYTGSYVDLAASFVFDDETYFDMDARAEKFFSDRGA
jgi:hypothetical protein